MTRRLAGGLLLLSLAGCGDGGMPEGNRSDPVRIQGNAIEEAGNAAALPGTPMSARVAVLGLLNKRNGLTRDLSMKPGEALRVGDAIVRLRACETSAPWENVPETGAFVQLDVRSAADNKWRRAFSGWLFKERPERNVVEHPIYDVWVKSCTMEWPEAGPDTLDIGSRAAPGRNAASTGSENASEAASPGPRESNEGPAPSGTSATASDNSER